MERILLVDGDQAFNKDLTRLLKGTSFECIWVERFEDALDLLRDEGFRAIIIGLDESNCCSLETVEFVVSVVSKTPVVATFKSPFSMSKISKQLLPWLSGVLSKDSSLEVLPRRLESLCYPKRGLTDSTRPRRCERSGGQIKLMGRSLRESGIFERLTRYSELKEPVLILGESGTGKELVAQGLKAPGQLWFPVNCANFLGREGLLESELFGHVRGAFTGADRDHKGVFEAAGGGLVFLDEIHTLSLASQQKLLRVLQEGTFRRVGDSQLREIPAKFRLVAAAKDDLHQRIQEGTFLKDFFFRISTLVMSLPPLRERLEDLDELISYFLGEIALSLGKKLKIENGVRELMATYPWPGNIRELRNAMYRMAVDCVGCHLNVSDFVEYLGQTGSKLVSGTPGSSYLVEGDPSDYRTFLHSAESNYFQKVLASSVSCEEALRRTGVSRSTLYRKLSELGLKKNMGRSWIKDVGEIDLGS